MLKTFGTRTQGYVRRGKRSIYIGTFDDARVAEAAAFHAAMRMPEDLEEEEDAHKEKILPPRPSTKSHGVVLWTTRKYESGEKELGNYKVSHYEGYISKVSREPHGEPMRASVRVSESTAPTCFSFESWLQRWLQARNYENCN